MLYERIAMRTRLVLLLLVAPRVALAEPLGESGESCRTRSDCRQDLRCVDGVCTAVKQGANTDVSFGSHSLSLIANPDLLRHGSKRATEVLPFQQSF
jgi:hypothetical protein